MELVVKAAALCMAGALLALAVRQGSPVMGLLLTLGVTAAVLLGLAGELFALFRALGEESGLPRGTLAPLYKTLGIALVVKVGGSLCRDAGESALAAAVETAGSVCALLCALPLLRSVLEMLMELMR